jgi:hypothetical protein
MSGKEKESEEDAKRTKKNEKKKTNIIKVGLGKLY